ncbi:tripartite tricarboxylate transporter substrate binding protein [Achromobacter aloeverae]|uniref:LacI family transcriptional regulator n=1 Tax=Achromobacter aloeverae TaxID=1750518 RepID=A0A4Q1HIA1_9BURK|nr:tripartite tricarboxylate transporter substrate binding protein [Achromobacter aloeverae]RXN87928.1 LacI family transcriptional regulator [Achromobacter aloeverae]
MLSKLFGAFFSKAPVIESATPFKFQSARSSGSAVFPQSSRKKPLLAAATVATTALLALLSAAGAHAADAGAASYPDKPIRIILGFPAGGGSDVLLRSITPGLAQELGQPVIVDNRPGAGGNLAMEAVARAEPDGYTLLMGSPGLATNPFLYKTLTFDPIKDFAPIGMVGSVQNALIVQPSLHIDSVAELVRYAKAHPGVLNVASSGTGTSLHLAAELFKRDTGVNIVHVPYRGGAPAMTDLLGGRVDMMFNVLPQALPQVKAGKLKALAVTGAVRSPTLPDVPTMEEAGVKGYTATTWNGLLAPAGTPPAIVNKINAALNRVLAAPATKKIFDDMGQDVVMGTPAEFAQLIKDETAKWKVVIQEGGIQAQ